MSIVVICAQIEAEIAELESEEEKKEFLESLGLEQSGLDKLIKSSYSLLGLMSYLTAGVQEVRAWTITVGTKAPQAAGKIHSDMEKGFIRGEIVNYKDLVECGSIAAAREKGKVRLDAFARHFPDRFFDVGIAEEHAVTFAGGLAKGGLIPVVCIYSTFIQRSIDQVIHDIALPDFHVIFVLDRSGAVPNDGETHQGIFDIALFRSIPDVTILAPASSYELKMMLSEAVDMKGPVVIRYPKLTCPTELEVYKSSGVDHCPIPAIVKPKEY